MRKRSFLVLSAALMAAVAAHAQTAVTTTTVTHHHTRASEGPIHVTVNEKAVVFNGPGPIMVGGSAVMVPVRGVFESFGGQVQWEPKAQVVEGARPGHQFRIRVGSNQALVDGTQKSLTTPPRLIGGTTYVPLRFASEALGAHVAWQPDTRTVVISARPSDADDETGAPESTTTTTTTTTTKK